MNPTVADTAQVFKALGDGTRLKILKIIAHLGNVVCVGMIADRLNITQPAVSQHLKVLKNAGIVQAQREGFHVHYSIVRDCLSEYGMDTRVFFESFGAEMDLSNHCHHQGDSEGCQSLNSRE